MTEAERCPCDSLPACSKGRNAIVVKYTEDTFVLKVDDHSEKDSELKRVSFSSVAEEELGSALGPAIPAFVIRRLMYFSLEEMRETRDSRSSFLVTSHGPILRLVSRVLGEREERGIYEMISPPPFEGEWDFTAFSSTSGRRPVM